MPPQVDFIAKADGETKAKDTEWFDSDLIPRKGEIYRLQVFSSTSIIVEVTLDSGLHWALLNNGVPIGANRIFAFDIFVLTGDTFNVKTPTTGGTTLHSCRVFRVN